MPGATEFGRMPENEWNAAVLAAGDRFDCAHLTAKDLFTRDLDPPFLEQHVRSRARQATRDLSEGSTALYGRLIAEGLRVRYRTFRVRKCGPARQLKREPSSVTHD
jgi:hypothetical protein